MISHPPTNKAQKKITRVANEKYSIQYHYDWVSIFRNQLKLTYPSESAILISQMLYMTDEGFGCRTKDQRRWIYQTFENWGVQLGGLNRHQIRTLVNQLCKLEIIERAVYAHLKNELVDEAPKHFYYNNQTTWWWLNVEKLNQFLKGVESSEVSNVNSDDIPMEAGLTTQCEPELHSTIYNKSAIYLQEEELEKEILSDPWEEEEVRQEEICSDELFVYPETQEVNDLVEKPILKLDKSPKSSDKPNKETSREAYPWERLPGRPHALFIKWWAEEHYVPQGNHWKTGARCFAMSQINNHPDQVEEVIYPQFLAWMKRLRDNCNQTQVNDIKTLLPSWFADDPEATEENTKQIIEDFQILINRGAELALPDNHAPGSKQSIPFSEGVNSKVIQPMQQLKVPELEGKKKINPVHQGQIDMLNRKFRDWKVGGNKKAGNIVKNFVARHREYVELTDEGINYKF